MNLHGRVTTAAVTEHTLWSDALFSETTVEVNQYRTAANPQGGAPMELLPIPPYDSGNFFNRQTRSTMTYQLIETVSGSKCDSGWPKGEYGELLASNTLA